MPAVNQNQSWMSISPLGLLRQPDAMGETGNVSGRLVFYED